MARWKGDPRPAWAGSNRKSTLPADWDRLRVVVLKRCNFVCEWTEDGVRCTSSATDVDHIDGALNHSLSNLQGLCNPHHLRKTGLDVAAKQAKLRELLRRPEEPQPGRIDGPPTPREHKGF